MREVHHEDAQQQGQVRQYAGAICYALLVACQMHVLKHALGEYALVLNEMAVHEHRDDQGSEDQT